MAASVLPGAFHVLLHHFRPYISGADAVAADVVVAVLVGDGLGHLDDGGFGDAVADLVLVAAHAGTGTRADDGAIYDSICYYHPSSFYLWNKS